jgi:hypothetical protein
LNGIEGNHVHERARENPVDSQQEQEYVGQGESTMLAANVRRGPKMTALVMALTASP